MATQFSLTAKLNLQLGSTAPAIDALRRQLSSITASIKVDVAQGTTRRINNLNQSLPKLEANLIAVAKAAQIANASLGQLGTGRNINLSNLDNVKIKISGIGDAAKKGRNDISNIHDEVERFGAATGLATKRFAAFVVGTTALFAAFRGLKFGLSEAINFQREIVRLGTVTGKSTLELRGIVNEITRLSTGFGVSSAELSKTATTLAQAGLSATETKIALEALAKTTLAPTFGDIASTTDAAIAAMSQFDIKAQDLEKTLGKINAVAAAFAVESDDLAEAIRKSGGTFKVSGGNLEELIALFTSVRATTRESAESIATGFRTIFARLQRKDTLEFLRNLNIELEEAGKFVGPLEAIRRLSAALNNLPQGDIRLANISEELGGLRQISRVIPLILQFEKTQQALAVAQSGSNSLTIDAARAQEALIVKVDKLKESFLELFRTISENKALLTLIESLTRLSELLLSVSKVSSTAILALAGLGISKAAKLAPRALRGLTGNVKGEESGVLSGSPVDFSGNSNIPIRSFLDARRVAESEARKFGFELKNLTKFVPLSGKIEKRFAAQGLENRPGLSFINEVGQRTVAVRLGQVTGKVISEEIIHSLDRFAGHKATGKLGAVFSEIAGTEANKAAIAHTPIVHQQLIQKVQNSDFANKATPQQLAAFFKERTRPAEVFAQLAQSQPIETTLRQLGLPIPVRPQAKAPVPVSLDKIIGQTVKRTSLDQFKAFVNTGSTVNAAGQLVQGGLGISSINNGTTQGPPRPPSPTFLQRHPKISEHAGTAGLLASLLAPALIDQFTGTVETNAPSRRTTGAIGTAVGSGIVSGASVGLLTASVPGAIIGGLIGLAATLKSESDKIRKLEFAETLDGLSNRLKKLNADPRLNQNSIDTARAIVNTINKGANVEAPVGGGFLNKIGLGGDPLQERALFFGNQRSQLPDLIAFRNKLLDSTTTLEEFRKSGKGLGEELITLFSQITGLSIRETEEEIQKEINARRKARESLAKQTQAIQENADVFRQVSALGASIANTVESLRNANNQIDNLASSLGGNATGLNNFSFGDVFSRFGQFGTASTVNQRLGFLANNFGPVGEDVATQGKAFEIISRTLPTVLERAVKEVAPGAVGEEDSGEIFGEISKRLNKELQQGGVGKELSTILSRRFTTILEGTVANQSELRATPDFQELSKQVLNKADVDSFVKQLGDFFKEFEGQINVLHTRLNQGIGFELDIEQRIKDLGEARLNVLKTQADFSGKLLPLGQLNAPFLAQQENLTGGFGIGTNVNAIVGRRKALQQNLDTGRADLGAALLTGKGPINELRENVFSLSKELAKADKALENLANASNLSANAQERLAVVNREREALTGFGRQLAFGTGQSRFESLRGVSAGLEAIKTGDLRNIPDEFHPDVDKFFSQFADVRFGNRFGKDIALDVVKNELNRILPKNIPNRKDVIDKLSQRTTNEQQNLQDQILDALKIEAKAREALLDKQQNTYEQFIETTKGAFTDFIEKLKESLKIFAGQENDKTIGRADQKQLDAINREQLARNLAARTGGFSNLVTAKTNFGDLEKVQEAVKNRFALEKRFETAQPGRSFTKSDFVKDRNGHQILIDNNGAVSALGQQLDIVKSVFTENTDKLGISALNRQGLLPQLDDKVSKTISDNRFAGFDKLAALIDKDIQSFVQTAKDREVFQANIAVGGAKAQARQSFPGISTDQFNTLISDIDLLGQQFKQLGEFNPKQGLDQFTKAVKDAGDELERIKTELANRQGFAQGGLASIFKPQGTDTIPAMLTKGEFVINAKASQKHRALLEAINADKVGGFSEGGLVQYLRAGGQASLDTQRKRRLAQKQKLEEAAAKRKADKAKKALNKGNNAGATVNFGTNSDLGSRLDVLSGRAAQAQRRSVQAGETRKTTEQFDRERLRTLAEQNLAKQNEKRLATGRKAAVLGPEFRIGVARDEKIGLAQSAILDKSKSGNRFAPGNLDPVLFINRKQNAGFSNVATAPGGISRADEALGKFGSSSPQQLAIDEPTRRRAEGIARQQLQDLKKSGGLSFDKTKSAAENRKTFNDKFNELLTNATEKEFDRRSGIAEGIAAGKTIFQILNETGTTIDPSSPLAVKAFRQAKSFADVENFRRAVQDRAAGEKKLGGQQAFDDNKLLTDVKNNERIADNRKQRLAKEDRDIADARQRVGDTRKSRLAREAEEKRLADEEVARTRLRRKPIIPSLFAAGGFVGPDTVNAALSPGEFVLNRTAVSRLGVRPLQRFNRGGLVYKAGGGPILGGDPQNISSGSFGVDSGSQQALKEFNSSFRDSLATFNSSIGNFSTSIESFSSMTKTLADAMNKFPRTVEVTAKHQVEVIHNGAQIFNEMMPAVEKLVEKTTAKAVSDKFNATFGGQGHVI